MVFLVLIGSLVIVGVILKLLHHDSAVSTTESASAVEAAETGGDEVCCGLHEICNKSVQGAGEMIYFDDEELDRFSGRNENNYTSAELEEFRDILLTLPVDEITLWQESLQKRDIPLPTEIRDEMIILLAEFAKGESLAIQKQK